MKNIHSPQPWAKRKPSGARGILGALVTVRDADGMTVCYMGESDIRGEDNAIRIVATARACAGLSLPADVPEGALLRVVEALAEIVGAVNSVNVGAGERFHMTGDLMDDATAALAAIGRG